jgi:hypothetical protein
MAHMKAEISVLLDNVETLPVVDLWLGVEFRSVSSLA